MLKTCTKCEIEKLLDDFPNEVKRKDGKYPWCKSCLSKHRKERYIKTPRTYWITHKVCSKCKEWKPREEFRKYVGNNLHYRCISCEDRLEHLTKSGLIECSQCGVSKPPDNFYKSKTSKQCIECRTKYYQAPDIKLRRRDHSLQKFFGISLDQYKELLKKQNYICPICLVKFEKDNFSYPVDHAHGGSNVGIIRGIVHDRCNRFVLWRHNDPLQLQRAADLIENPLTNWFVPEDYIKSRKHKKKKRKRKRK